MVTGRGVAKETAAIRLGETVATSQKKALPEAIDSPCKSLVRRSPALSFRAIRLLCSARRPAAALASCPLSFPRSAPGRPAAAGTDRLDGRYLTMHCLMTSLVPRDGGRRRRLFRGMPGSRLEDLL